MDDDMGGTNRSAAVEPFECYVSTDPLTHCIITRIVGYANLPEGMATTLV